MATTLDRSDEPRLNGHGLAAFNGRAEAPLSQAALLSSFWRRTAPPRCREGGSDPAALWKIFAAERRAPKSLAKLCSAPCDPLTWAIDLTDFPPPCLQLLAVAADVVTSAPAVQAKQKLRKDVSAALADWLPFSRTAPARLPLAMSTLAAAHLLSAARAEVNGQVAWEALDRVADIASQARHWTACDNEEPTKVLTAQLLAGELPLALSYHFSEMEPLFALRQVAYEQLSEALLELLNGRGLPRGGQVGALRPLMACWTRCRAMGDRMKEGCWSEKADRQYQWLVRQSLRWTAGDESPLLSNCTKTWPRHLLRTALDLGGDAKDAAAARSLLGKSAIGKWARADKKPPQASDNCEWSCLAVMRSDWSKNAAVFAVDYSQPVVQVEAWAEGRQLLRGPWLVDSQFNGKILHPRGEWEELCWFSDRDVDYLELGLDLSEDVRLERQVALARRDGFLLLADHLKAPASGRLQHVWQISLADGIAFRAENETRDAVLVDDQPIARLLPVALPEWRIDPRRGSLTDDAGRVCLASEAIGQALACPLFIDLRPQRVMKPSTWRQLTVAEGLAIQPADVAVAYRVQCGKRQWAYYRAQGRVGNRTFLGQNTSSESIIARFLPATGGLKELVEIEGDGMS